MGKIDIKQISDNEVQVILAQDAPMELVNKVTGSLSQRGLIEDLSKSTVSNRFFYRQSYDDSAIGTADRLIKSLECLAKAKKLPYWAETWKDVKDYNEKIERLNREDKLKSEHKRLISKPNIAGQSKPNLASPKKFADIPDDAKANDVTENEDFTITPKSGPSVLPPNTNKLYNKETSGTVEYKKTPSEPNKSDDGVNKSDYGPKGGGQYDAADNAKRKERNTGDVAGEGPNKNVKAYSSKPAQLTANQLAEIENKKYGKMSAKSPVKVYSQEEKDALAVKMGLKKSWVNHNPIPNAEVELAKIKSKQCQQGNTEQKTADQLRDLLAGKSMLGIQPPPQPTNAEMFGHLAVSEEMAKSAENKWSNTFNNWLSEAQKPINARFASPEAERAYWDKIKINDSTDGCSGS